MRRRVFVRNTAIILTFSAIGLPKFKFLTRAAAQEIDQTPIPNFLHRGHRVSGCALAHGYSSQTHALPREVSEYL